MLQMVKTGGFKMTSKKTGMYVCASLGALLWLQTMFTGVYTYTGQQEKNTVVEAKATAIDLTAGVSPELAGKIEAALELEEISSLEASKAEVVTASLERSFLGDGQLPEEVQNTEAVFASAPSPYENTVLPDVEVSLNIRAEAAETAAVVGKLYRGTSAEILETAGQWTKIRSGSVEGWVMTDYVVTGEAAEAMAAEINPVMATVNAETLRVRQKPSEKAVVLAEASAGESFVVKSETDAWVEILYTSKVSGYVAKEYVTVQNGFGTAVSADTEEARTAVYVKKEQERAAEAAKQKAKSQGYSTRSAAQGTEADIRLIAAVCDYEAGSGSAHYQGQLAVANVIVNRLKSGKWGGSVSNVVYAPGQFTGVNSGKLQRILSKGPSSSSIKAAQQAMAGVNNVGNCMFFCSARIAKTNTYSHYIMIGGNCFYSR